MSVKTTFRSLLTIGSLVGAGVLVQAFGPPPGSNAESVTALVDVFTHLQKVAFQSRSEDCRFYGNVNQPDHEWRITITTEICGRNRSIISAHVAPARALYDGGPLFHAGDEAVLVRD